MKNNTITIGLVVFIIIIYAGYYLISNLMIDSDTEKNLQLTEKYAREEDWNKVIETTKSIKNSWSKDKYIVMFNHSELEFTSFENHLNQIIGGAEDRQLGVVISNIISAQGLLSNLHKLIPEP